MIPAPLLQATNCLPEAEPLMRRALAIDELSEEENVPECRTRGEVMANQAVANSEQSLTLEQRRRFLKLPLEERRRQMAEQAAQMVEHYEAPHEAHDRAEWQGGDIVECA